ncbi:helix-turn-helix transcriptional regulator [Nodosilinea sp. LEGE 06152]|uniref:helix-turn-helix transcriptional regulator n=1 Tax=Nodosilinea sp. LEGE 06152 TaxID=2777966 RepID=UPI001882707B|nr:AraC family transcriptional regulator [Nodosilinea sp. LEGE 06152]MBE9157002.1 helix-turn-helix transcriptional regulator [Nodosilinea sp. LEGE 06152]
MTIHLSQQAYWELLASEIANQTPPSAAFEQRWEFPQAIGAGQLREISLRDGLTLELSDYELKDAIAITLPDRPHGLEFSFCLEGEYGYNDDRWGTGDFSLCGAGVALAGVAQQPAPQTLKNVTIHLEPAFLETYGLDGEGQMSPWLKALIGDENQPQAIHRGAMTTAMAEALRQLWQSPHGGGLQRLYLESKALELVALLIEHTAQPPPPGPILKPDDVQRIHQARAILMAEAADPPSLLELARRVGLNDYALKRGFRHVFGTTAFGFLHQYRLDQARQLLDQGDLNVSEVARAVGFTDRSYFATAFRKKFGLNPRAYLRSQRQLFSAQLTKNSG